MKRKVLFTVSLLMLGIMTLTGCGTVATSPNAQYQQATQNPSYWATMTNTQIISYYVHNGEAPPFGGTQVYRVFPIQTQSVIPNGYLIKPQRIPFRLAQFTAIDYWKGYLLNKPFALEIFSNRLTRHALIGISYDRKPILAYEFASTHYVLRGFSSRYVVFGIPNINGPYFIFNIMTGALINQRHGILIYGIAGGSPAAAGPEWITGLPKKYPFTP